MSLLHVAFVVLLSCCGLRYVGCAPSFTRTPNDGKVVYVLDGARFQDLVWSYNSDGLILEKVELLYFRPDTTTFALVARKVPNKNLQIFASSGYSERVEFYEPATFRILNIDSNDSRIFQCKLAFENADPPEYPSNAELVVVVPPTITTPSLQPTKQIKDENQTVSYSCTAEAIRVPATIVWVLNGQNLTRTPPYNITVSYESTGDPKLFRTISTLTINQLTWRQYGNFSCVAYNDAGQTRWNTELEVRYRPVVQFSDDHPKNLTLSKGQRATFTCKTIGNPPTTGHKWQFNGTTRQNCSGCISTTYTKDQVNERDAGWYSCIGTNSLGDGPPARAQLLVKHKPTIDDFPNSTYTVNETNSVTMVCGTKGVPKPKVTWRKISDNNDKIVGYGEKFTIANTKGSDDGTYTCTAKNDLGSDAKEVTLNVQTRPTISTFSPEATNIPAAIGEDVKLTCIVIAKPPAKMSWKRDLNGNELSPQNDNKVKSIPKTQSNTIEMTVNVGAVDEEFYCVAVNFLGNDTQKYRIREIGTPDPPTDVKLEGFQVPGARTVSVKVSWTAGYSGGFPQSFSIHYRKKGSNGDFIGEYVGAPRNYTHTVKGLSPNTEYEFMLQAANERGKSQPSKMAQVMTPESSEPQLRGTAQATRSSDDPTVIIVTWTVIDKKVTRLSLEIQEGGAGGDSGWKHVPGASDMNTSKTEFKVENLKAEETYLFRMDMRRPGEEEFDPCNACYVISNKVVPAPVTGKRENEGLQNWMIAVIAAVAGVLLIAIVVLVLCCFKRRKKPQGADNVNMSQTSSYVVGGPEVSRSLDTRPRSYGMESVEDDPFIEAHFASMQSMNSADGKKKKKPNTGVNYGYLSQDSVQPNQPEMLLNPGSRLPRNHPVAQSTGDLDAHSAYPARGPQRDFSTLPPYHEPPSFEEAMRQSGRKPKTTKSTGDLAGPGPARHSGRRPRHSPSDEPTDSSDGELRYTPLRTAPPPPRVRQSRGDPGYAEVDQGRVLGPRVLPQGPPTTSAPRNGPLDPTVPYAAPQKKKSKKPRSEPSEPGIGPPPQYTPEDRSPEEPMHHPGDLDLDDPSTLPPSERPPDLPPPMAMLPSNRRMPSYEDDLNDGLPEPPEFLRDVVYPPDGREPLHDIGGPASYHPPPSSSRQRQPYVNIHGQLVRPPSRGSDDFRRPDSLRSSRDALTPEPEMPPRQRGSESDDRGAPEINYVSYLV